MDHQHLNDNQANFLFKTKAVIIVALTAAMCVALLWFGFSLSKRMIHIEQTWKGFNTETANSGQALSRIVHNFGYGGFIHHFKNFVLRKDSDLIPHIESSLEDTRNALQDFEKFSFSKTEREALDNLQHTVELYAKNFLLAKRTHFAVRPYIINTYTDF